jgi:hypothetical protein
MPDRGSASHLHRHARREAVVVIVVWALALVWTVGYCYLHGYQHEADSWVVRMGLAPPKSAVRFRFIAGVPEWVMVGIMLPWAACTAFTMIYSLWGMKDHDLGAEAEGDGHGH